MSEQQQNLVIVESPAKAKTLQSFLGNGYRVVSSFGHIRDLPKKDMGIDIANDFEPKYVVTTDKKKVVHDLQSTITKKTIVWLASDEDREGEAIAWHLFETLGLSDQRTKRIVFHEITKTAIQRAMETPRNIDQHLVDAQQARRILDRLVGYELSPILWRKIRPGLSAGRVQSVAVRLIVEREREIMQFTPSVTFKLSAVLSASGDNSSFSATYEATLSDKIQAKKALEQLAQAKFRVVDVSSSRGQRNPAPPFTTSTLQQEANQRLGYSVKQTMRLAQRLYESGAITYMRTDSVALSQQSLGAASQYISQVFGPSYHQLRTFTTKSKGAQEAHEAIRPTDPARDSVNQDPKAQKLYSLIRGRFLASQMTAAITEKTLVVISNDQNAVELQAKGETLQFDGWMKAYPYAIFSENLIPPLTAGQSLTLLSAEAIETYSRPPARFTEATLVRQLEEMGIGRPSTYAPTISTIQDRGYVSRDPAPLTDVSFMILRLEQGSIIETRMQKTRGGEKRRLSPTDTAVVVNDFLHKHFPEVIDYDFTAKVEAEFDTIAKGNEPWKRMIRDFYSRFHTTIEKATNVSRSEAAQARDLGIDPKTQQPIFARYGRYGPMLQRGMSNATEKPQFAPLPQNTTLETVTLEQALSMFALPRELGVNDQGVSVRVSIGRYGPYVQMDKLFASIPKEEDIFSIDLQRALEIIDAKRKQVEKSVIIAFTDGLSVKTGRFGPYITDGTKNVKIPKNIDPASINESVAKSIFSKSVPKK